jgi:Rod binding domain-containing protein
MAIFANGIFGRPTIGGENTKGNRIKAAQAFTQVFTTMMASEARKAYVGSDKGPMGINGGTSGNIYGSFFDQAMGSTLAHSKSMKPLTDIIERGMEGPKKTGASASQGRSRKSQASNNRILPVSFDPDTSEAATKVVDSVAALRQFGTDLNLSSDSRGPVLLPPEPTAMAPVLPPPSPIEG